MPTLRVLVFATSAVIAVAASACGAATEDEVADRDRVPVSTTTSTTEPAPPIRVDWLDKNLAVDLDRGYRIAHCPGDAPMHCITEDGEPAGVLELQSYPVQSLPEVRAALRRGEQAALQAHVDDFVASLAADRAVGCGRDYQVTPEGPTFFSGPDGLIAGYGFSGGSAGSRSERTVQWAGIRGDVLTLLSISAYDPGACLGNEGLESTTRQLDELEPELRRLVEASPLPAVVDAGAGA